MVVYCNSSKAVMTECSQTRGLKINNKKDTNKEEGFVTLKKTKKIENKYFQLENYSIRSIQLLEYIHGLLKAKFRFIDRHPQNILYINISNGAKNKAIFFRVKIVFN